MKHYNKMARQTGMTLIELTVVLLVLIGLAGLLIPYVSGFVSKTHDSTGTNNLAALNGNFARFENEYMRAPDRLESLVNASAATNPNGAKCQVASAQWDIYCNMMNTAFFETGSYNMVSAMSLSSAGLTEVLDMDADTDNATFGAAVATPRTIAAAGALAKVSANGTTVEEHMADAFGGQSTDYNATCYDYVAFGIGDGSEMIGRTMNSAPIHFAQNGDMAAANKYNRFVAVYKVDKDDTTAGCSTSTERAKFVGTAMAMGSMAGHLWGLGHSAGHAYENLANQ